jgi:hypothetical protein
MKRVLLFTFWAISCVAAMVCLLCDFVISKDLDWSLIVGLSLVVCGILFTVVIRAKQPIRSSMTCITVMILPFLFMLSMILQERLIFSLGGSIAVVSCLFLWGIYGVYLKFRMQIFIVLSITVLLTIPLVFSILFCCKYFLEDFTMDLNSSVYNLFVTVLISFALLVIGFVKGNKVRN